MNLGTIGPISPAMLLILALPVLFFRILSSAIRVIRYQATRKLPKRHLLILLLFPAACVVPYPLPTLVDGAARTLRELHGSEQMLAVVAGELASRSPDEGSEAKEERNARILAKAPFSRLHLKYADLRILNDSLLIEFGSPIAFRWGFSVSGIPEKSPSLPEGCFNLRTVSKEITVFEGPTD